MKSIALALASLLWASSAFASEESGQQKNTPTEKNLISPGGKEGLISRTPNSGADVRGQSTQSGTSPASSSSLGEVAVPKAPAIAPAGADAQEAPPPDPTKGPDSKQAKQPAGEVKETVFKEMVITGETEKDSHYTSPSVRVTRAQIERQNAQTTEEVLKYMPSLQIRQRYVGDPNGVLGIRGADMFSTARNMVYADGLPLHNFLQASFNGAPRWSLVGPNEIDSVDVVYGPFSAEYSGNSIGGVVNIKTRMPRKQEFYVEGSLFIQPYKLYGPDKGTFIGDRQYVSYGNRIQDKYTVFLAYNRLEAQSHPQSYFIDNTGLSNDQSAFPVPVTGGIRTPDTRGTPSMIYGDTGPEKVNTHLFKGKFGYDITPELQALFTVAYEDRSRNQNRPNN
jgi:iron complex outermembrane receptor protein